MPLNKAGARRPLFSRELKSRPLQQHSINTRTRLRGSSESRIHQSIETEFSRDGGQNFYLQFIATLAPALLKCANV
jgi:hypothetical protein